MTALLQFNNVAIDKISDLSFAILPGETRVLKVASAEAKAAIIEMALGELVPASGEILLHGQPLEASSPECIGWIPAAGGLISNLKTWENITLPLWYHSRRQSMATEESISHWLFELELARQDWEKFMASPVALLNPWESKMAGLLRGLVLAPEVLVIDAELFSKVEIARSHTWIKVLENFVNAADKRAVLVVANTATLLPWKTIE